MPRDVRATSKPGPSSAISKVSSSPSRPSRTRLGAFPACRRTFWIACKQQKYAHASTSASNRRPASAGASTVACAPTLRMCASSAGTIPWSASRGGKTPRARSRRPSRVSFARSISGSSCAGSVTVSSARPMSSSWRSGPSWMSRWSPRRCASRAVTNRSRETRRAAACTSSSRSRIASSSVRRTLCTASPACAPRSSNSPRSAGVSGSFAGFVTVRVATGSPWWTIVVTQRLGDAAAGGRPLPPLDALAAVGERDAGS